MASMLVSYTNSFFPSNSRIQNPFKDHMLFPSKPKIHCSQQQQNPKNRLNEYKRRIVNPSVINPDVQIPQITNNSMKEQIFGKKTGFLQLGNQEMLVLCGYGYYVNGFRGFPWLALNFHMAHNLNMHPSTLQIVQNSGNLPMVAKPLYGIVSDALYIGGAHRIPYVSIGGSIFCYQSQCLNLDPSVIGMSRVTGQLMLLSLTVLYDRFGRFIPMRRLVGIVQFMYAFSLLFDLALVKQLNLQIGIPNEVYALCFSGLAETIAQFKLLPFYVLFANLAPSGCEGSLMSFLASTLCLSSTLGGFFGVGLASFLGITSGNYSNLSLGIVIQFFAALLPLHWIDCVPMTQNVAEKFRKRIQSKRTRRNRRVGRVLYDYVYSYRRERESDLQK